MPNQDPAVAHLAALAAKAADVAHQLSELHQLWDAAQRCTPGNMPKLPEMLQNRYPFGEDFDQVVPQAHEWARYLSTLADAADDRLAATAEAIRQHVIQIADGDVNLDFRYEVHVRNGLGGSHGDVAAAFHPRVQIQLANLLDALAADDAELDSVREQAGALCKAYMDARSRDAVKGR